MLSDHLIAISKGDRRAFEELYALSSPRLFGIALRLLRQPELAAAALKSAYLAMWSEMERKADALRAEAEDPIPSTDQVCAAPMRDAAVQEGGGLAPPALRARIGDPVIWMVSKVRAAALDFARAQVDEDGAMFEPFASQEQDDDPLGSETRSPELLELLGCLGHLSEERRRMVLLAYYDGWTRNALSIYFDAPEHSIRTWLRRSIGEIDACLQ
ncbi:sigma factor-like helix-turn-helix DNA-binding protein [Xanthobacter sp. DSM 24535]|uniref:sigma factor-like helix-turn-helix DNA-binding protein n=1 Tax=Roseixanthobacter psychrophilus TaxID=3119917 RepID=UPI0037265913